MCRNQNSKILEEYFFAASLIEETSSYDERKPAEFRWMLGECAANELGTPIALNQPRRMRRAERVLYRHIFIEAPFQRESHAPQTLRRKAMLSANDCLRDKGLHPNAGGPCDFSLNEVPGLDTIKLSKWYPRGSVLFSEGQPAKGIYVVSEGRAKVSIGSADGRTLVLRIAEPGEILGINAAITGQPHAATVEALERCRFDFISRTDLLKLLEQDGRACLEIALALGRKLTGVLDHTRLIFLSRSAPEKLARLLMRWADESGEWTSKGTRISVNLTHEELAQMIGSSRETVTRALSEFKRKQIIGLLDDAIYIRNRQALESAAHCS